MDSLFNYLITENPIIVSLLCSCITLFIAVLFTITISLKMHSSKSFFITSSIIPMVVSIIISVVAIFLDNTTTNAVRIISIAVALGLIRFRSINGKAEEMLLLFVGVGIGLLGGLGLVAYAAILAVLVVVAYLVLSKTKVFDFKKFKNEQTLNITIPETVNYKNTFDETFDKYLKQYELVGMKTTNMGSLYRLTYRIVFKNMDDEKEFVDELRTLNSNLDISIVPFVREEFGL